MRDTVNLHSLIRLSVVGLVSAVAGVLVMLVALRYLGRITPGYWLGATASVVFGGIAVLVSKRWLPDVPIILLFAAVLGSASSIVIGGWVMVRRYEHPQLITLDASMCDLLQEADRKGEIPARTATPCRFVGHLFPSEYGWYVYGVSENVKDQCLFFARGVIDMQSLESRLDAARMPTIPAACHSELDHLVSAFPPQTW